MATYTSYLNLEKPTTSETFNLLKMNQNWDKIDAGVSSLNSKFTPTHQNINFIPSTTRVDVASIIKSGQIVMVCLNNVSFTDAMSSEDVTLATLPYKPVNWVRFFGYTINGNPIALGVNPSSGNLICSGGLTPVEAGKLIYASFTYITGD